jgi:hypothetical protein
VEKTPSIQAYFSQAWNLIRKNNDFVAGSGSDFGHTHIFTTNYIPIFNVFDDAKHLVGLPYIARSESVPRAVEDVPTGKGIQDPGKIVAAAASKNLIVHFEHQVFAKLRFPGVPVVIKNPQNMTAILLV